MTTLDAPAAATSDLVDAPTVAHVPPFDAAPAPAAETANKIALPILAMLSVCAKGGCSAMLLAMVLYTEVL